MQFRHLLAGSVALALLGAPAARSAIPANISYTVGVCNPLFPQQCIQAGPFVPDVLSTVSLAVTTSSARVQLTGSGGTVLVTNNGTTDFYVKLGGSTVAAATTDFYVKAGAQVPLARGVSTYIAAITASSTSTLIASTGNGTPQGGSGGGSGGGGGNVTVVGPLGSLAPAAGVGVTLDTTSEAHLANLDTNSGAAIPAGTNTIGQIRPFAVTPAAGTASAITTGGTAKTMVTGPVNGCYITNPASATDQGITTAENAYVNPVTTATTTGNGTNLTLAPGQSFYCPPGQTTNVSVNAATTSHALTVVVW